MFESNSENVLPPTFKCPNLNCRANQLLFDLEHIIKYFYNTLGVCPECNNPIDLFRAVSHQIAENFMNSHVYSFLGAKTVWLEVELDEEEGTNIDLTIHGVSESSKLLHLNYSPQGNLWPLEMNSNEPLKKWYGLKRHLRSIKIGENSQLDPRLSIIATFIDKADPSFESIQLLLEAFMLFEQGNYSSAIVPANVAVELPLSRLMYKIFGGCSSEKTLEIFFTNSATYSHQLNVLFPYIAKKEHFPLIGPPIKGNLNRLRKLRNDIAHKGSKLTDSDKKETGFLLASALFANVYLNHLLTLD